MKRSRWREVNGVLVLDKPIGESSNASLQKARRLFSAEKAGHTGALDPLASGVLPICFGEATKFSQYLLDADKAYDTLVCMGTATATGDVEGEVVATAAMDHVDEALVQSALARFVGTISQVPPMYSALKHQGQPLYKLARKGVEVDRPARDVEIYSLEATHFGSNTFRLAVRCSKGTYIRTLVEDLCVALGTVGHVGMLRRTQAASFTLGHAHTFEVLSECHARGLDALDAVLLPPDVSVAHWPKVVLDDRDRQRICLGQRIRVDGATVGMARIYGPENDFLGVGEVLEHGVLHSRRLTKTSS